MAPTSNKAHDMDAGDPCKPDRKTRKPLIEKKRRARINESLKELRVLIADTDLQAKMENAEVLEMTVKRVESIMQSRANDMDTANRESCERFAAGYIQCMHDVHTFVSSCPGIDQSIAAELLNHLLESMPLSDQDELRATPGYGSSWSENMYAALVSPGASTASTDDLCSDLEETDSEQSQVSSSEEGEQYDAFTYYKSVWRPW